MTEGKLRFDPGGVEMPVADEDDADHDGNGPFPLLFVKGTLGDFAAEGLPELIQAAAKENLPAHRFLDRLLEAESSQRAGGPAGVPARTTAPGRGRPLPAATTRSSTPSSTVTLVAPRTRISGSLTPWDTMV